MDMTYFDSLARAIGTQATRRLTLGVLLGAILGRRGVLDAAAKRKAGQCKPACPACTTCGKGKCRKQNGRKHCKQSKCVPAAEGMACAIPAGGACENGACACPGNLRNIGGVCGCTAAFTNCGGVCVDLPTDATHCGSCGNACPAGWGCCDGVCKNLNTDTDNCGGCESHCGNVHICCFGHCIVNGYDEAHCTGCGNPCPPNQICCAGECCPFSPFCNSDGLCCRLTSAPCDVGSQCCSDVCLPANMGIPYPHCA